MSDAVEKGLENKRVLVTAGAGGIGRAVAEAFLDAGARVHICDIDADALSAFADERPDLGSTVADVADVAAVDRLFADLSAVLGDLDILVKAAGAKRPTGPIETLAPEAWRQCVAVNLDGQFHCARRAVPMLKAGGGGSIVCIASTAGIMGYPLRTPYAAAKWGVIGLAKTLALELGDFGIRVNAICPGPVRGARMEAVIRDEAGARGVDEAAVREDYTKLNALRTLIDAEDIASMILFLCSDAGRRITGQVISVDGDTISLVSR